MPGYNAMLRKIKPSAVLCYDEPFAAMRGNIRSFLPTQYAWTKNLDWKEKAKFQIEKHMRYILQS